MLELREGSVSQVIGGSGQGLSRLAEQLRREHRHVGVVSQDALAHITFLRETVAEEVAFGLEQRGGGQAGDGTPRRPDPAAGGPE